MSRSVGRPSLGETRKVSITLPSDIWKTIDEICETSECSLSAFLRDVLTNVHNDDYKAVLPEVDDFYKDSK